MAFFDYAADQAGAAERLEILLNIADSDWEAIAEAAQNIAFRAGDTIVNAGNADTSIYILVEGKVEVLRAASFGREKRVATIDEGSLFGELAFFDAQPRSANIRALTNGHALRLSRQGFDRLSQQQPHLARELLLEIGKVLAYRYRKASSAIL